MGSLLGYISYHLFLRSYRDWALQEEFVDGALGANNLVYAVWSQAQDLWGADQLQDKLRYLVWWGFVSALTKIT